MWTDRLSVYNSFKHGIDITVLHFIHIFMVNVPHTARGKILAPESRETAHTSYQWTWGGCLKNKIGDSPCVFIEKGTDGWKQWACRECCKMDWMEHKSCSWSCGSLTVLSWHVFRHWKSWGLELCLGVSQWVECHDWHASTYCGASRLCEMCLISDMKSCVTSIWYMQTCCQDLSKLRRKVFLMYKQSKLERTCHWCWTSVWSEEQLLTKIWPDITL